MQLIELENTNNQKVVLNTKNISYIKSGYSPNESLVKLKSGECLEIRCPVVDLIKKISIDLKK